MRGSIPTCFRWCGSIPPTALPPYLFPACGGAPGQRGAHPHAGQAREPRIGGAVAPRDGAPACGPVICAPRSLYVAPTWMMAGLSPLTCTTGGVAEESGEDDAAGSLPDG